MNVERDRTGKRYIEVPTGGGEHVRFTHVSAGDAGYGVESIRIQIRDAQGHLRMGPELPLAATDSLVGVIRRLCS